MSGKLPFCIHQSKIKTNTAFPNGFDKQIKALRRGVDVVVACPGRLSDLIQQNHLRLDRVQIVVLDEADRMADMGFMPQVEWVLRRLERSHQTLLF